MAEIQKKDAYMVEPLDPMQKAKGAVNTSKLTLPPPLPTDWESENLYFKRSGISGVSYNTDGSTIESDVIGQVEQFRDNLALITTSPALISVREEDFPEFLKLAKAHGAKEDVLAKLIADQQSIAEKKTQIEALSKVKAPQSAGAGQAEIPAPEAKERIAELTKEIRKITIDSPSMANLFPGDTKEGKEFVEAFLAHQLNKLFSVTRYTNQAEFGLPETVVVIRERNDQPARADILSNDPRRALSLTSLKSLTPVKDKLPFSASGNDFLQQTMGLQFAAAGGKDFRHDKMDVKAMAKYVHNEEEINVHYVPASDKLVPAGCVPLPASLSTINCVCADNQKLHLADCAEKVDVKVTGGAHVLLGNSRVNLDPQYAKSIAPMIIEVPLDVIGRETYAHNTVLEPRIATAEKNDAAIAAGADLKVRYEPLAKWSATLPLKSGGKMHFYESQFLDNVFTLDKKQTVDSKGENLDSDTIGKLLKKTHNVPPHVPNRHNLTLRVTEKGKAPKTIPIIDSESIMQLKDTDDFQLKINAAPTPGGPAKQSGIGRP